MTKPSVCRMVLATGGKAGANSAEAAPAVITRVWSQREDGAWLVNATLLPDAGMPCPITSVYLFEDEEAARAAVAESQPLDATVALYWPPRA